MKSICLAFAMFSRVPVPKTEWDERNMRHVMAALPLVGVAVGAMVAAWGLLCDWLPLGPYARGAGFAILPVLVTGGIHLDGFSDTVDALASHGDVDRRRQILKDPHVGSFAVMAVCSYLIAFSALAAEAGFSGRDLACFALAFVLSRTVSGLSALLFPCSPASGLGKTFQSAAAPRLSRVLLVIAALCLGVLMPWCGGAAGLAAFLAAFGLLFLCGRMAAGRFGGMSGDLSGWLLQMSELASLACLAVIP